MTSVNSNFNFLCGGPHGAGPPPSMRTCVHLSPTPSPLRVDVINGWPLNKHTKVASAARRQIIGGGALVIKKRRQRPQIDALNSRLVAGFAPPQNSASALEADR